MNVRSTFVGTFVQHSFNGRWIVNSFWLLYRILLFVVLEGLKNLVQFLKLRFINLGISALVESSFFGSL